MQKKIKDNSKLGLWLENNNLDTEWIQKRTKFPMTHINKLINDDTYKPDGTTMRVILSVVKTKDSNLKLGDFWDV